MINILVVDDEKVIRDFIRRLLEHDGSLSLFFAEDGYKAVDIARKNKINLAFIDLHMPGIDGIKTYKEIKNLYPDIACVFTTGYAVDEVVVDKANNEKIICLKKPFEDILQIRRIVREVQNKIKAKEQDPQKKVSTVGKDRRTHVRINTTLEVVFKIHDGTGELISALGQDISPGGVKLVCQQQLQVGAHLDLMLKVPGHSNACKATGEVTWQKKNDSETESYAIGLKFTQINLSELAELVVNCGSIKDL